MALVLPIVKIKHAKKNFVWLIGELTWAIRWYPVGHPQLNPLLPNGEHPNAHGLFEQPLLAFKIQTGMS